jgi:DNA-binding response OmpR family regulator
MRRKLLIEVVDDDAFFCKLLQYQLNRFGYVCRVSHSPEELFWRLDHRTLPDIFILDMDFGENSQNGLQVCRWITESCHRPVMMVTADARTASVVACLNAGAQQYMVKPCHPLELEARLKVMSRLLPSEHPDSDVLDVSLSGLPPIRLDIRRRCMFSARGLSVALTEKELELLQLFFRDSDDGIVNREVAFRIIYGYDMAPSNRAIDVLICRLRKKFLEIEPDISIRTLRGEGYVLVNEQLEALHD